MIIEKSRVVLRVLRAHPPVIIRDVSPSSVSLFFFESKLFDSECLIAVLLKIISASYAF